MALVLAKNDLLDLRENLEILKNVYFEITRQTRWNMDMPTNGKGRMSI